MPTSTLPAFNGCAPPTDRRRESLAERCQNESGELARNIVMELRRALNLTQPNLAAWLVDVADSAENALLDCGAEDYEADGIEAYERIKSIAKQARELSANSDQTKRTLRSLLDANRCKTDTRFGILSDAEILAIEGVARR
jgi:hypothetical protein